MTANIQPDAVRLHHLDNLRVFCMIFGVYYHAAAMGEFGWIEKAAALSPIFRMKTFFFVSGYFGAMLLARYGTREFLENRTAGLALPLLSTFILINPAIIYLRYGFLENVPYGSYTFNQALQSVLDSRWDGPELHLWFLLVLIIYVFLLALVINIIRYYASLLDSISAKKLAIGFAVVYVVYMFIYAIFSRNYPLPRLATQIFSHLPFYLAGAMSYHCLALRKAMQTPNLALLLMGIIAGLFIYLYRGPR